MDGKLDFQDPQIYKDFNNFLMVYFGTMLPRLDNDTISCIINLS